MEMCDCSMGSMCTKVTGVLVGLGGLVLLLGGMNSLPVSTSLAVSGLLVLLTGLGFLVHGMGMCGMCNAEKGKKSK